MRPLFTVLALACFLSLTAADALAEKPSNEQLQAAARAAGSVNGLCPVRGQLVTAAGGLETYKGEKIGFCSPKCLSAFRADPTRYMDRMRLNPPKYWYVTKTPSVAAMRAAKAKLGSANGRCPVMGRVVVAKGTSSAYRGQRIQFCCPPCKAKFDADPERYMRLMRADPLAYAYDRPGPTNTQMRVARTNLGTANGRCPVMGKLVVAKGGTVQHGGQAIGFCCPPCVAKFKKEPEKYMRRLRDEPAAYGYVPRGR
jgi:YHS domain-containing protein